MQTKTAVVQSALDCADCVALLLYEVREMLPKLAVVLTEMQVELDAIGERIDRLAMRAREEACLIRSAG